MSGGRRKILVFGIDGGTMSLVGPWAKRGELPNLARLIAAGTSGALRSTIHPLTPQAWTSFLTGVNPGKHGVFDFGHRRPGGYELGLTDSRHRRAPAIWSYLEPYGLTTGLMNVPMTFPLERVHGFQVSGMHTPTLELSTGSRALLEELRGAAPDYQIDVMSPWYEELDAFLRDVRRMVVARGRAAVELYRRRRPDLFVLVMVAVDRVCHALYGQMSHPQSHGRDGRAGWKYSAEVLEAYRAVDRVLGDLLAEIDDETVVIVMSDHGFGSLERDVSLNQLFLDQGLMSYSPRKVRPRLPVVDVPVGGEGRTAWGALVDRWRRVTPLRWIDDGRLRRGRIPAGLRRWEYIDWGRTVAYSHGFFGNVYVNLRGREPEGSVDPADYERVRERIAAVLVDRLVDPEDGGRIVDQVYRREELFSGPFLEEAPDLVVVMRGYSYITRGGCELSQTETVAPTRVGHSGNHRLDGMLVMWGPGIRQGATVQGASIMDLMPTMLQILGVPVPQGLDGRVLGEALERPEHLASMARRLLAPEAKGARPLTAGEERIVRRRLRNLGYFE